ncbi:MULTISPECIES: hypothetical protein [Caldimonas]|uniref:hypothetical protein n=1 Tax=Caldimonas TaxID=196013 RepID=UPI0005274189|nr:MULTISPECIES: hypothetical protein [Caldimonas]
MRILFSLAAVLIVLAVLAVLAKQQLSSVTLPAAPAGPSSAASAPLRGSPSQQLEQFRQGLDQALQQPARKVDE